MAKETTKKSPDKETVKKPRLKKNIPTEMSWRVFLAQEHPWRTVIFAVILAGVIFLVGRYIWDVLADLDPGVRIIPAVAGGLLTFLLLFGTTNNYFVPISYHMDADEIVIKKFYYIDKRNWGMFRRFFLTRSGVVLSTFSTRKKFLDNFRGVQLFLPSEKKERDRILDFIQEKLPLDAGQSRQ